MKKVLLGVVLLAIGFGVGWWFEKTRVKVGSHEGFCAEMGLKYLESVRRFNGVSSNNDPLAWSNAIFAETKMVNLCNSPLNYPDLSKYEILKLSERNNWGGKIELGDVASTSEEIEVRKFYYNSDGKKISGLAHIPKKCVNCPVIVQIRGYYDREKYFPGAGTNRTAVEFARAGFISLAPDFLGYGESDMPSTNVFEARFQTYTTVVNLAHSISSLGSMVDPNRVGVWGHSNGGQVALTLLEITKEKYPTALWAPVTAEFPYSILYYTYDNVDGGAELRKEIARMEEDYDVKRFAFGNYLDRIEATILLQQGTADPDVPVKWSRDFVVKLRKLKKEVKYKEYDGADHNLLFKWDEAVVDDIAFFKENL